MFGTLVRCNVMNQMKGHALHNVQLHNERADISFTIPTSGHRLSLPVVRASLVSFSHFIITSKKVL